MNERLLKRFRSHADQCQQSLDKFSAGFAEDPAHSLSWSLGAFENAAKLRILKQIITALEAGNADLDNIRSTLTDRVMHRAKYPPQSSSPTSNLIEQYEMAACAKILEDLQYVS